MTKTAETNPVFGKDLVDTGLKSFAALQQGFQTIAAEAGDYGKKSYEAGTAAIGSLASAKTLEQAIEIQTGYTKDALEGYVAEVGKLGELFTELARDAYKPYESMAGAAR